MYIVSGNIHLKVKAKGGTLYCILEDSEEVNRHKPSVEVLFNSLKPLANNAQAILLKGIRQDRAKG